MVYHFSAAFDIPKAAKIHTIIRAGVLKGKIAARIMETLEAKGVSYRKLTMLHDIRRGYAVELAKTKDTRISSGMFFDYVYEPFRKEKGLHSSEVNRILRHKEREFYEDEKELEMQEILEDRYVALMEII